MLKILKVESILQLNSGSLRDPEDEYIYLEEKANVIDEYFVDYKSIKDMDIITIKLDNINKYLASNRAICKEINRIYSLTKKEGNTIYNNKLIEILNNNIEITTRIEGEDEYKKVKQTINTYSPTKIYMNSTGKLSIQLALKEHVSEIDLDNNYTSNAIEITTRKDNKITKINNDLNIILLKKKDNNIQISSSLNCKKITTEQISKSLLSKIMKYKDKSKLLSMIENFKQHYFKVENKINETYNLDIKNLYTEDGKLPLAEYMIGEQLTSYVKKSLTEAKMSFYSSNAKLTILIQKIIELIYENPDYKMIKIIINHTGDLDPRYSYSRSAEYLKKIGNQKLFNNTKLELELTRSFLEEKLSGYDDIINNSDNKLASMKRHYSSLLSVIISNSSLANYKKQIEFCFKQEPFTYMMISKCIYDNNDIECKTINSSSNVEVYNE